MLILVLNPNPEELEVQAERDRLWETAQAQMCYTVIGAYFIYQ